MEWLKVFKKQNQLSLCMAGLLAVSGIFLHLYSLSGTKYDVIEYCFKPRVTSRKKAVKNSNKATTVKFCTDDKKYILPKGFYQQERYTPTNPRFQREDIFVLSDKMTRLRDIPATNKHAKNSSAIGLLILIGATFLASQRLSRYRREFAAYFENLKTDLNQTISLNEQEREVDNHKIATETNYIKDRIAIQDEARRYQDKSQAQRDFEGEQASKHNELVEYQRQLTIAQFKAQIAKLESEEAKFKSEVNRHLSTIPDPIELAEEIDYEALCPGKVGELEFYDWRDLADDAVGILVIGNSGSGKTSVGSWIAGWLTKDKPAQILALDPHANKNPIWKELDIHVISQIELIEAQLNILLGILDFRQSPEAEGKEEEEILFFADEINSCLKRFSDPDLVTTCLERLGSEGRKYGMTMIGLNQSSNCDDIGISKAMRSNFLIVMLNAAARNKAETWKKDDLRKQHLDTVAYGCLVGGSTREMAAVHPTHHTYKIYKKKGNKPKGLLPINQIPLTIELASKESKAVEKDWHETFVDWRREIGRVPNPIEIADKWLKTMGREASSKQVEELHEYLKNLD